MHLPTVLVSAGAESPTTSAEFPGVVLLIDAASRRRVQMEHATRSTALMDHTAAPLIGPDTLMRVGELGGKHTVTTGPDGNTLGGVDEPRMTAVLNEMAFGKTNVVLIAEC